MITSLTTVCGEKQVPLVFPTFPTGYQSATTKMVAISFPSTDSKDSIAAELDRLFKHVDYATTLRPLKAVDTIDLPIEKFEHLDLLKWYDLDTSKCFMGKHKLKIHNDCIYDIFGAYCGKSHDELRILVQSEVKDNYH